MYKGIFMADTSTLVGTKHNDVEITFLHYWSLIQSQAAHEHLSHLLFNHVKDLQIPVLLESKMFIILNITVSEHVAIAVTCCNSCY